MIGTILSLASGALGGWKKWLMIGVAFLGLVAYIGILKIQVGNLRTDKATLSGIVDVQAERLQRATADIIEAGRVNRDNAATLARIRAEHRAAISALGADRDRLLAETKSVNLLKERIHVEAQKCVGVPPAFVAVFDWLRDTAEPAAGDH